MNEERKPVSDTELDILDNLGWHEAVREIRELRKDRERLDWIEKQFIALMTHGTAARKYWTVDSYRTDDDEFRAPTAREAIDAAMKEETCEQNSKPSV